MPDSVPQNVTAYDTPAERTRAARPAGLLRRLAAFVYDAFLIAALLMLYTFAVVGIRGMREVGPGTEWFGASLLLLHALFYCGFWVKGGQTLGMRAWKMKLERRDGTPVGWPRAAARYAAAWASLAAAGLGFLWSYVDRDRRCWHDILTDTRVVRL